MSVDIGKAIRKGLSLTVTSTGLILMAVIAALGVVSTYAWHSAGRTFFFEFIDFEDVFAGMPSTELQEFRQSIEMQFPTDVLDLPFGVLLALILGLWVLGTFVRIGAIRWFVEEQSGSLTSELFTRRALWTILNLIVGFVIFYVALIIGFALLVIPGIFLLVTLYFYNYEIIVEGENAIDALANSYRLTKGNRIELFLLGLVYTLVAGTLSVAVTFGIGTESTVFPIVSGVIGAVTMVAGIGIAAVAYNQLRGEDVVGRGEAVDAVGADEL